MAIALRMLAVTGLWVLIVAGIGIWIHRVGRPYGRVKTAIHIILTVFVLAGLIYSFIGLSGLGHPSIVATICLIVCSLALLSVVAAGIRMTTSRELNSNLPMVHAVSTVVMLLSIVAASVSLALGA